MTKCFDCPKEELIKISTGIYICPECKMHYYTTGKLIEILKLIKKQKGSKMNRLTNR